MVDGSSGEGCGLVVVDDFEVVDIDFDIGGVVLAIEFSNVLLGGDVSS